MLHKYKDILITIPLFKGIEEHELLHILTCLSPVIKEFKKGEIVCIEGDVFNGIGLVIQGKVTVTKTNEVGERMIMVQLQQGGMFGEMVAFSSMKRWPATVIAETNSIIMNLSTEAIINHCQRMCVGHKQLMLNMLEIVSNKAIGLNRKVQYLSIKSMRGKLAKFLMEEFAKKQTEIFDIKFNRNELAEFLNVSRPSMSRELAKMKEEKIIDYYQFTFKLLDKGQLSDYASHLH